jgi:hypothetical protein
MLAAGFFVLQGFNIKTSDDDPNVDQPIVHPNYLYKLQNLTQPFIIVTDAEGFDNYNMGNNFATYVAERTNLFGINNLTG